MTQPCVEPRLLPFGDAALIVEFGDRVDRALSAAVLALDARLRAAAPAGLVETAPSFRSLLIEFDPSATDAEALSVALRPHLEALAAGALTPDADADPGRLWRLPACYAGACAPDLAEIAARAGWRAEEVVRRHSEMRHHVYMIGFLPGCPYMGDLPAEIDFPRRADPRVRVPAGSVAIAVGLTVIYPTESPGGWHLIGRTPTRLFDPDAQPPALLAPGDSVAFEPIDEAAYVALEGRAARGEWRPEPIGTAP